MPALQAPASYKKAEGLLKVNDKRDSVSWIPANSTSAQLEIAVADITNIQQSPAGAAKIALKVVVKTTENHVFYFTSDDALAKRDAITDTLRTAILAARAREEQTATGDRAEGEGGASGSMAFAQTVRAGAKAAESWYDDQALKSNVELQQSLLRVDPALRQRFEQSLRDKPESITNSQFQQQFWSARLHLLRAHAIEKNQTHGVYNVLAEVKPKVVDGATMLNLTKEQIQLIFNQHPLVKRVYDEVVPKLSERDFWSRFFVSRLFKKLKGERITDNDSTDAVLDRYLKLDEDTLRNRETVETHVPHFIDLEGNEQNHSQRQGNQPDFTMRPNDKIPILRVLNNMSEKMLSQVALQDHDEASFDELRLRDLQSTEAEDRVILNIKDQHHLFGSSATDKAKDKATTQPQQPPGEVLASLCNTLSHPTSLSSKPIPHADASAALAQLTFLIAQQRALLTQSASTLPNSILDSLRITHSTTTEFLHYFWTLLRSANPSQKDLTSLLTTLAHSLDRIAAVANEAEAERKEKFAELKRNAAAYEQRTGKRRKVDESMVTVGGKKEVDALMGPTVQAIAEAKDRFGWVMGKATA